MCFVNIILAEWSSGIEQRAHLRRALFEHLPLPHQGVTHAAGLAAELDEPAAAGYAVDGGGRHPVVAEDRAPPAELEVRRDRHRLGLVGVGEDLEDQPGAVGAQRQEPELVDDEQAGAADLRGLPVEPALVAGPSASRRGRGQ